MKLYTEEQVIDMLSGFIGKVNADNYLNRYYTPIELPSDEEAGVIALTISNTLKDKLTAEQEAYFISGFQTYSKWMRDKILNK